MRKSDKKMSEMTVEEMRAYKLAKYHENKNNTIKLILTDIELIEIIKIYLAAKEAK